jgi:nicotinate-nucleotide pyrophosphorylase
VGISLIALRALLEGKLPHFSDITTDPRFTGVKPVASTGEAYVWAKSTGILSGSKVFARVYDILDPSLTLNFLLKDGERFVSGDRIAG